jgi:hypothetical protein
LFGLDHFAVDFDEIEFAVDAGLKQNGVASRIQARVATSAIQDVAEIGFRLLPRLSLDANRCKQLAVEQVAAMNRAVLALLLSLPTAACAGEYEQYWNAWRQSRTEFERCSSVKKAARFLQDAISNVGNAERTEANAEAIENIIVRSPACFFSALSALDHEQCEVVVRFFVRSPTFHSAKQIEDALQSVKQGSRGCYVS